MFRGPSIESYCREAIAKVQAELQAQTDDYVLGVDEGEYTDYLFGEYALEPIERDQSRDIQVEFVRKPITRTDPLDRHISGQINLAKIEYPIQPSPTAEKVLGLLPSQSNLTKPQFELRSNCIIMEVELPFLYTIGSDVPTGSEEIRSAIANLEWWNERRNSDIARLNPAFRSTSYESIKTRRGYIQRTNAEFAAMVERVPFGLKLKTGEARTSMTLPVRRELKPILKPPTPRRKQEIVLNRDEVLAVVEVVRRWGRSLETTPQAVAGLDEPDIRALLLAQLNGIVDGGATGETFSKCGKTDVHLNLPSGEILIAECKIWRGAKAYGEALDQLFLYLTWRECYGIVITFVRNRDFANTIDCAIEAMKHHGTFRGRFERMADSYLVSAHRFPDDPTRSVEVHHLMFHFPSQSVDMEAPE